VRAAVRPRAEWPWRLGVVVDDIWQVGWVDSQQRFAVSSRDTSRAHASPAAATQPVGARRRHRAADHCRCTPPGLQQVCDPDSLRRVNRGEARVSCLGGWAPGMASAGARTYNGGLGAEPPAGSRGRAPGQGARGGEAPWSWKTFSFWMCNGSSKFASFCPNLNLK